jgi:hypothetical protein
MPFYFYTIILGMVIGAVFTWFIVADHPFESREAPGGPVDGLESGVLATQMKSAGFDVDEAAVTKVLRLHGAYVVGDRLDDVADEATGADGGESSGTTADGAGDPAD